MLRLMMLVLTLTWPLLVWSESEGAHTLEVGLEAFPMQQPVLTVCPQGPPTCQFAKIQEAIDAAPPKATIEVAPGLYTENLVLYKEVFLKGAGAEQTIVRAAREGLPVVLIVPRGGAITGFTITRAKGSHGVQVYGLWHTVNIYQNVIVGNSDGGIQVVGSSWVDISDNIIRDNGDIGVWLQSLGDQMTPSSGGAVIQRNQIVNHRQGILIWNSHNVRIQDNIIHDNPWAGISFRDASIIRILRNTIERTNQGAAIEGYNLIGFIPRNPAVSSELLNLIQDNIIQSNWIGIALSITLTELRRNQVMGNREDGIILKSGQFYLKGNVVVDNGRYGLWAKSLEVIEECQGNLVYGNQRGDYIVGSPPQPSPELKAKCEGG